MSPSAKWEYRHSSQVRERRQLAYPANTSRLSVWIADKTAFTVSTSRTTGLPSLTTVEQPAPFLPLACPSLSESLMAWGFP